MNLVQQYVYLDLDAVQAVAPQQIEAYLRDTQWVGDEALATGLRAWARPGGEPLPGHLRDLRTIPPRQASLIWPGYVCAPTVRRRGYTARVEEVLVLLGLFERRLASDVLTDINATLTT
ncbi:hypothetical protein [Streptomyces anulatus]|uniref:hypothetical protein n=1 Tax=Streptomyces anulatus TaxID=1892 RepID=UPI001C25BBCF|nr:hypothetical protein [Streptomyces anulatus]